jgi:predicted flap endonuclease-1-like 5' DNA nuclease
VQFCLLGSILKEEGTMLRRFAALSTLLLAGFILTGLSTPAFAASEPQGNPWWIWILVFFALVAFVGIILWWWLRGEKEDELELPSAVESEEPSVYTKAHLPEVEVKAPSVDVDLPAADVEAPAPTKPDDLKRIEGIGPKIASVLRASGIATFSQLADANVGQLRHILEQADPRLLRLADPTTWPEQAELAAQGAWEALEELQDRLQGGRRS